MSFERLVPGTPEWESYYANHIFRYRFAAEKLLENGKTLVLDAACGVGYGSYYLANNGAEKVIAVDRSDSALVIAKEKFSHDAINYLKDDCESLEKVGVFGKFDAVVSFETIEHIKMPEKFLLRIYSLLNFGGLLIVSTPNAEITSPQGKLKWKYHEKEYTVDELTSLLTNNGFGEISIYGQALSSLGRLRDDVRAELNRINSNPFTRLGKVIQKVIRGYRFPPVLPEKLEDFMITTENSFKLDSPFVLIAVAKKV